MGKKVLVSFGIQHGQIAHAGSVDRNPFGAGPVGIFEMKSSRARPVVVKMLEAFDGLSPIGAVGRPP